MEELRFMKAKASADCNEKREAIIYKYERLRSDMYRTLREMRIEGLNSLVATACTETITDAQLQASVDAEVKEANDEVSALYASIHAEESRLSRIQILHRMLRKSTRAWFARQKPGWDTPRPGESPEALAERLGKYDFCRRAYEHQCRKLGLTPCKPEAPLGSGGDIFEAVGVKPVFAPIVGMMPGHYTVIGPE
jgi:hypothetical protein